MEILIIVGILRIVLVWQMTETIKCIKTPGASRLMMTGFIMYLAYLVLSTAANSTVYPDAILRIVSQIIMFVAINRTFTNLDRRNNDISRKTT